MFIFSKIDSRRHILGLIGASIVALSACGGGGGTSNAVSGGGDYETEGDHAIGNPDAAVTVVEYASVVCGACANWHNNVYPEFKAKYIDSGLVRFVFREFPTSPENLARAGFLIANCVPEDRFFDNISLQFKRQTQIFAAAGNGTVRNEYINIAKAGGLSEAEFEACLTNEDEIKRYEDVVKAGIDAGVSSTPTFFVNGEKGTGTNLFLLEDFDAALAPLLGDDSPPAETEAED